MNVRINNELIEEIQNNLMFSGISAIPNKIAEEIFSVIKIYFYRRFDFTGQKLNNFFNKFLEISVILEYSDFGPTPRIYLMNIFSISVFSDDAFYYLLDNIPYIYWKDQDYEDNNIVIRSSKLDNIGIRVKNPNNLKYSENEKREILMKAINNYMIKYDDFKPLYRDFDFVHINNYIESRPYDIITAFYR